MFTRHATAFDTACPAQAVTRGVLTLCANTIVETSRGWSAVGDLRPDDALASLDGGFVPLASIRAAGPTPAVHIPARALGNCTDVTLPADAWVGLDAPGDFILASTDVLSAPLDGFDGYRGIRISAQHPAPALTLGLASEEMLWVQTGMLIHARPMTTPYFHTLTAPQTQRLLADQFTTPDSISGPQ